MPTVSVITPFLNAENFLTETLDSLLAQTHTGWELLLVDDGSTDSSAEIARRFARENPRQIRCLEHPGGTNRGTFASRILGARKSRAPVLTLLDADDLWAPDYLANHLQYWRKLKQARVALSYGPASHWFPGDPTGDKDFVQTMPSLSEAVFQPGELLQNFLSGAFSGAPKPSCCLLSREAFLELARFSDDARRSPSVEDWFLAWGIGARWPIAVHTRAMVRYRRKYPTDAIPKMRVRKALRDEFRALPVIRDYLAQYQPEHALLRAEGIPARIEALRGLQRLPPFGDYFLKRIPKELRRLSRAR